MGTLSDTIAQCLFERRQTIVVAVSGGSDSTALLLLLKDHLTRIAAATKLVAVTVDHQLRRESRAEAEAVGRLAAAHGIDHRILSWSGEKPISGIAAAARQARYRLLAKAATEAGTDVVVTGHTADDQAETVLMRRQRGDGLGLAGMAPATLFEGTVWIVRPLLATRRADLRAFLTERDIGWVDDPSNADPKSERVRARLALNEDREAPGSTANLLDLARQAAARRMEIGQRAASLIRRHAHRVEPGLIRIDPALVDGDDHAAAVYALRILLAVTGGTPHPPDEARTQALARRLAAPPCRATMSRALVVARRDGIWLCREQRGLPEPRPVRDGMIWDGRYRISAAGPTGGMHVAAAGTARAGNRDEADGAPSLIRHTARACLPTFQDKEGVSRHPHSDDGVGSHDATGKSIAACRAVPVLAPWATFLPCFDLEAARAVAELVGAAPIPDPPCAGHNVTQA